MRIEQGRDTQLCKAIDKPIPPVTLVGLIANAGIPNHDALNEQHQHNKNPPTNHDPHKLIRLNIRVQAEIGVVKRVELVVDAVVGLLHVAEGDVVEEEVLRSVGQDRH